MAYYTSEQAPFRLSQSNSSYLSQLMATGKSRTQITSIALAMLMVHLTPLPGGEIESPAAFFMENGGVAAAELIGTINNMAPVNCRQTIDLAKQLYLIRYEMANCPFSAFGYDRKEGIESIFGLKAHLGDDVLKVMRESAQEITNVFARFKEIAAELKKD